MDHFAPLCESSTHDFPVIASCQQMATWTEERCDNPECREKPLGVPGRLETSHATFSFSRRLMRILGAIVRSLVLYVPHIGQYLQLGSGITAEFVGDDSAWHIL